MRLSTRKLLDRSFTSMGLFSILIMGVALLVILVPLFVRGIGAFVFEGTIEHRRLLLERYDRGDAERLRAELDAVHAARKPIYDMLQQFEDSQQAQLKTVLAVMNVLSERTDSIGRLVRRRLARINNETPLMDNVDCIKKLLVRLEGSVDSAEIESEIKQIRSSIERIDVTIQPLVDLKAGLRQFLGPEPGEKLMSLPREQYGPTRWSQAEEKEKSVLYIETWDYSGDGMGKRVYVPRVELFRNTELEPLFDYVEQHAELLLLPQWTFYWGFLADEPLDIHMFGGILPELIGTIYLTLGAILFAVPIGIITAIYFSEYAKPGHIVTFLRTCVSTLAGVPSIVFGMFGLAFFLNFCHMPKGVLAGALTLALLILPTIIRASEEAIRAVPHTYREAALGLGAGKWHAIITVILPAALPGVLTGTVISMGRAAGETAPIIFTAAASVAATLSLNPLKAWNQPTSALSWNLYNLCTEHEAASEIRHVQFGMAAILVSVVLLLNLFAIILRARIAKKLKG